MGVRWHKWLHTAQRWSRMRKLPDPEAKDNRNAAYICIYRILHHMGPEACNIAKESGLRRSGSCRQAGPADHNVISPGNGNRI